MWRAEVAQSVEHCTENAGVVSSILTLGTLTAMSNLPIGFSWKVLLMTDC